MTQPNPSVIPQSIPGLPGRAAGPTLDERSPGLTVWLFGLTAMALVFASLMLLGPLAMQGGLGSQARLLVAAYAIGMSCIGLFALAYVVSLARRMGLLAAATESEPSATEASSDGLVVARSVPARQPLPEIRRLRAAHAALERRPRSAVVAAASARPVRPVQRLRLPSIAPAHGHPNGHPVTQAQAAALQLRVANLRSPWPAHPYMARPPMHRARPAVRPVQPWARTLPPPAVDRRCSMPLVPAGPPRHADMRVAR